MSLLTWLAKPGPASWLGTQVIQLVACVTLVPVLAGGLSQLYWPCSQAWTSVLAWYTGHPVSGLRHPGTCLSRRAFPTILALQPSLDQCPRLPHWPPGLWLAALAGATTAGGWGTLHRLVGYSCPYPQLLPNQSVTLHHTYSIAHIGSAWGITD